MKLYSPLVADMVYKQEEHWFREDWEYPDDDENTVTLGGMDLVDYMEVIEEGIEDEALPEEAERGLMAWYGEKDSLNDKVQSLRVTVEEINGRLYGVAVCEIKGKLTPDELAALKEYCAGQYSDGWGEGFEQRERQCADGELYVHFWQPDTFFICTEQEMERNHRRQQNKNIQRGGSSR